MRGEKEVVNGWRVIALLWQPHSFHRDSLDCPKISWCKSLPWSCSSFRSRQSLLLSLLQAGLHTDSNTLPLIVAVGGKSIQQRTFGNSCRNLNSLLENMRWSVSGVPPSGSIRGKQPFFWRKGVWGQPNAIEFKKEKKKMRAKMMQTKHTDLCQAFEM